MGRGCGRASEVKEALLGNATNDGFIAGGLRGAPVELTNALTRSLAVLAHARRVGRAEVAKFRSSGDPSRQMAVRRLAARRRCGLALLSRSVHREVHDDAEQGHHVMMAAYALVHSVSKPAVFGTLVMLAALAGGRPAQAQSWEKCVEAIAQTQHELKQVLPHTAQPQTQQQSIAAQDSHEPTPGSLAAAGLEGPVSGPAGALNEAENLQAAGDEAGCMKAVAKARSLAGLK